MHELPIEPYKTVLVLNSSYEPINFTNWKRAIVLLLKEKAQVLSSRVIRLLDYVKLPISKIMNISPSRSMIYKRDNHTCQYCGARSRLTIDHVIPRSKGGEDSWENLVVACSSCNTKKGRGHPIALRTIALSAASNHIRSFISSTFAYRYQVINCIRF